MILPESFLSYTRHLMGDELFDTFINAFEEDTPVSIRINPFKCNVETTEVPLMNERVAWCENGIYLSKRPNFTFDPLFHAGLYYVQEASSMFLTQIILQYVENPVMMLDLCAAPGGKSTVARSSLPSGSLLFCNEPSRQRANILSENIQKFGHPDTIVTNNYPADYVKSRLKFDVILVDVPCSGEGMFRKDESAIGEWSVNNVEQCRRLQREIIADAWACLNTDGLLIYSTCTFNSKENEENIAWITSEFNAEILPIKIKDCWGITGSLVDNNNIYRFIPGKVKGEGLFIALIRKKDETATYNDYKSKARVRKRDKTSYNGNLTINKNWILNKDDYTFMQHKDYIMAIPQRWKDIYDIANEKLQVLDAGVTLGKIKGKDIVPAHSLALSVALNKEEFNSVELNYKDAVNYLRKEAIQLPQNTAVGHVLMTYKGIPIGFAKNIGNRANNLYPQEWKIKSTHVPDNNENIISLCNNI